MSRTIRFHLDEHVPHAVADALGQLGIEVSTTTAAGLLGAADADHLAHGLAEVRVIFTEDDDFLALAASGVPHAGLVYCARNTRTIGQIVRALELLWEVYEPDEMKNRTEFI